VIGDYNDELDGIRCNRSNDESS